MSSKKIYDILIFYSNNSPRCDRVKRYVDSLNIPISWICVDTKKMRDKIQTSRKITIRGVPTLAIIYESTTSSNTLDKAEIFEGDKVLTWLYENFGAQVVKPRAPVNASHLSTVGNRYVEPKHRDEEPDEDRSDESTKYRQDDEIIQSPVSKPKSGKSGKVSKIDSIKALAREMEEQRRQALDLDDQGNNVRRAPTEEFYDEEDEI